MRFLRWAIPAIGVPLLAMAALAQGVPDAALRLTPTLEPLPQQTAEPPMRMAPAAPFAPVQVTPLPAPQPASFGLQRITYPAGVTATFDMIYANLRGYRPLTLDLYLPDPRAIPAPLVVFVHGGG